MTAGTATQVHGRTGTAARVLLLYVCASVPVAAQCPDGTPPPCAGQRVAALDPHRIAILPFRVTAADTLLGQGMAELLAPEFTGEEGPLAVNMPTVLRVWRRAGGGLRTPLDPAQAQGLARSLGAGRLVDGSVVGLGLRITVSVSVTELPSGTVRRVGPLSGPADSLEALVGRLASGLLAATGATPMDLHIRLTASPDAMRAYLEGMLRYREGDYRSAAAAFERAFAMDSLFAGAAFMRLLTGTWGVGVAGWDSTTWKVRDRLSVQDRILLSGNIGDHFPALRSPEQNVADRRRAATLLPQSAEAQFELADYLYHFGSATGIADDFAEARTQLELAYRMDPQYEELIHLVEIGFITGDTAVVRRSWTLWQHMHGDTTDEDDAYGRVVARLLGDRALAGRYSAAQPHYPSLARAAVIALFPANEVAGLFELPPGGSLPPALGVAGRSVPARVSVAVNTGRLSWLQPFWRTVTATLRLAGDSIVADAMARSTGATNGDTAGGSIDAAAVGLIEALRSNQADLRERTIRLDSMVRWDIANWTKRTAFYPGLLLSVAWDRLGEPARALAAVHLDTWELSQAVLFAPRLRQEGRLAAIVGDTARAMRAYRRYLSLRRDADPVLIPERDSVQAALARLEHR